MQTFSSQSVDTLLCYAWQTDKQAKEQPRSHHLLDGDENAGSVVVGARQSEGDQSALRLLRFHCSDHETKHAWLGWVIIDEGKIRGSCHGDEGANIRADKTTRLYIPAKCRRVSVLSFPLTCYIWSVHFPVLDFQRPSLRVEITWRSWLHTEWVTTTPSDQTWLTAWPDVTHITVVRSLIRHFVGIAKITSWRKRPAVTSSIL